MKSTSKTSNVQDASFNHRIHKILLQSSRGQALVWLFAVAVKGQSINELLAKSKKNELYTTETISGSQLAFAKQMLFGSLRFYHQSRAIIDSLLDKPLKQKDQDVYQILQLGIYQLKHLAVADHAAVSETVNLTKLIEKPWAAGLVNAVLRNFQRKHKSIDENLQKAKTYVYSHPNWIIDRLQNDWPNNYQNILQANNERAPMTLRVNQEKISIDDYQSLLEQHSMASKKHPLAKDALVMESPCDVSQLPNFDQGWVSVQDAAAQLAVELLAPEPNDRVLDGCAAPGGKTAHILQRSPQTLLVSVEKSASRLIKIQQTLSRLGWSDKSNVHLHCGDITQTEDWWDGLLFDRILIDVPCTASGVIRRNPDIKIHRKKTDLNSITQLQATILNACWKMLKPAGRLVYATCSIFKDENENQIKHFLDSHNAQLIEMPESIGDKLSHRASIGFQILPGENAMDGFYLCGLQKST